MPSRLTQLPVELARGDAGGVARATQLLAEAARGSTGGLARATQLVIEVIYPNTGGGGGVPYAVDASVGVTARAADATGSVHHTYHRSASVSVSVSDGLVGKRLSLGSVTVHVSPAASVIRSVHVTAFVNLHVKLRARNFEGVRVLADPDYIGRYQAGQEVPLWVLTRDSDGTPALPSLTPPVASVYNLDTHTHVADLFVPRLVGPRNATVFAGPLFLGRGYDLGRHLVLYRWSVGGFTGQSGALFEVQAAGDGSGPLIAGKVVELSESRVMICQSGGGQLLSAVGPYTDGPGPPAAAAKAGYTLSGPAPSKGEVGLPSANFTVTPSRLTATVTPSDGGQGGTFTPTSLTFSGSSTPQTFTYTPSTWGAKTVACTSAGAASDPTGVRYVAQVQLGGGNTVGMILPDLGGWNFFDPTDPWVQDVSGLAAHPRTSEMFQAMTVDGLGDPLSTKLAILGDTTNYGFNYQVVPENQLPVGVGYNATFGLTAFDGQTTAPIPAGLALEAVPYGDPLPTGLDGNDHHAIILVRDDFPGSPTEGGIKWVYELYSVYVPSAGNNVVSRFVLRYPGVSKYDDRPEGFPSTVAGGTRLLPGVIRHDALTRAIEAGGDLGHALRFDTQFVRNVFTAPARAGAGFSYPPDSDVFCCGTRIRLKAAYDISSYSPGLQVILRTLKKHGGILDDTGGQFQLQATMDAAWGVRFTPYFTEIQLVDVVQNFEVLDHPKGYTMTFPGGASGAAGVPATMSVGVTSPATHIDPAHFAGLAFSDFLDAGLTLPAGGSFLPYRVDFSDGDLASKSVAYTPAGAAGPRYVLGTDNTIGREPPVPVLYTVG